MSSKKTFEKPHGTEDALLPCPFCGNEEIVYEQYESIPDYLRWRCWCTGCLATIDPGWAQSKGAVQAMWNKRERQNG